MSISSTVVTDDWRWLDIGDVSDNTTAMIKWGLSGTAVFTPVGLTGVAVEDEPEWIAVAQPRTAQYTLGRLVGGDGVKGVRLISEVNGHPVVWRIERALRWNGQAIPGIEPVKAIFAGESNHLPDLVPIAADSETTVTDALVTVSSFIAAAETAASSAAADAAATASDATATAADRTATGQARSQAWSAADRADTAATTATTQADRAKTEADRAAEAAENVDTAAIRQEVTTQIASVVDGAPEDLDTIREVAEYAQKNRTITDTLNAAIGQKADKTHTHTVSDVTGLQGALDGKASTVHTHTADQVTMTADDGLAVSVQEVIVGLVEALPTAPEVTIVPVETMPPAAEQLPGTLYIRYGGAG